MSRKPQIPNRRAKSVKSAPKASQEIAKLIQEGLAFHQAGRIDEAIVVYEKILTIDRNQFDALQLIGVVNSQLNNFDVALKYFDRALHINKTNAAIFSNRGITLHALKRFDEALESYNLALGIKPNYAEAFCNRGLTLQSLKRFNDALESFNHALKINANFFEALLARGNVLVELNLLNEALDSYDLVLRIKNNCVDALNNKGNVLRQLEKFDESLECFEKVLNLKPDYKFLSGLTLHTRMFLCDWDNLKLTLEKLIVGINNNLPVSTPFDILGLIDEPELQKKCSLIFSKNKFNALSANSEFKKNRLNEIPRIGYFSADFHNHATLHLMLEVFRNHDKSRFDFYAFSFGPQTNDLWQQEAKKYFKEFIDIRDKTDSQVAELTRSLNIDIAIDLKGFTANARPGIFANRAAPIQINYLGYPGTMGSDFIDYIIADKVVIPEESKSYYSEKILYLPNCYQPNIRTRKISEKIIQRKDVGLPEGATVYCSFNNIYKLTPDVFTIWLDILKKVQNSVLWILCRDESAKNNLIKFARVQDVDSSRLIFAEHLPIEQHLSRISLADIFLDTFPCNGHTTASDAIRMGIPVVTMAGKSFASRVAASILTAVDMTDLITANTDDYKNLAIRLGGNKDLLQSVKNNLVHNVQQSSLLNSVKFARDLEVIYQSLINSNINTYSKDDLISKINNLILNKKFVAANQEIDKLLLLESDKDDYLFLKGKICMELKMYQEAQNIFLSILARAPQNLPYILSLAELSKRSGFLGIGLACLTKAIEINPQNIDFHKYKISLLEKLFAFKKNQLIVKNKFSDSIKTNNNQEVIILCAGEATRWKSYLGIERKHLIPIEGEILLERTIKQVLKYNPQKITVLIKPGDKDLYSKFCSENVCLIEIEYPKDHETPAWKYLSSEKYWDTNLTTITLLGDVWFSDIAIDKIFRHDIDDWLAFGRLDKSKFTGCPYGEIFALKIANHQLHLNSLILLNKLYKAKLCNSHASGWALLQIISNEDPNLISPGNNFVEVDDFTEDFDFPEDYIRWVSARENFKVIPS